MRIQSIKLAPLAAVAALAFSGCTNGGGDDFFIQEYTGQAPRQSLSQFFADGDKGEKLSLIQHTGKATLTEGSLTLDATAHGEDRRPVNFSLDNSDFGAKIRVDSVGTFDNIEADEADGVITLAGAETDMPDVGDDILLAVLTVPGDFEPNGDGNPLSYMSMVGWLTTTVPDMDTNPIEFDFGVGHGGLFTPEEDMPTDGTAFYDGLFAGVYVEPGTDADGIVADAMGNALFIADFGAATVEGGVYNIVLGSEYGTDMEGTPFFVADAGDIEFDNVVINAPSGGTGRGIGSIAGSTFTGGVVPGAGDGFMDFDEDSTGTLDGAFYGPVVGDGPLEAGAVLTLHDDASDDFVTGVIGANLD